MRKTCLNAVHELAKRDERVVFIGSDLGVGTLDAFKAEFPDRFFMEGVTEAHILGMAAGMAMEGRVVFVNTIGTFLTRRCFEQIVLDLCLHRANVRLIGSGGGLVYAPLGPTHEATEDLAILRALPGMTIVAPADADEMARLVPLTLEHPGPMYLRLGKGGDPIVTRPEPAFAIGRGFVMREGADVLLATTGVMLKPVLDAAERLEAEGVSARVLHLPTVKPLDEAAVLATSEGIDVVVTVEEHSLIGGLGSAVLEVLGEADRPFPRRFRRLALPDAFPDQYGSQASLLARYGLDAASLAASVRELVRDLVRS